MYYIGDTHGVINTLKAIIKKDLENCNLISVGDFGLGFQSLEKDLEDLKTLSKELVKLNIKFYTIRGNHDNPVWFTETHEMFPNITLVKDYDILNIENKNILFAGGAISIDRLYRKINKAGWWNNEKFSYQEINNTDIDVIITHSSPDFSFPVGFNKIVWDFINYEKSHNIHTLKEELELERSLHTKLYEHLIKNNNIELWCYGHFHKSKLEVINNTTFKLLNIDEIWEKN